LLPMWQARVSIFWNFHCRCSNSPSNYAAKKQLLIRIGPRISINSLINIYMVYKWIFWYFYASSFLLDVLFTRLVFIIVIRKMWYLLFIYMISNEHFVSLLMSTYKTYKWAFYVFCLIFYVFLMRVYWN